MRREFNETKFTSSIAMFKIKENMFIFSEESYTHITYSRMHAHAFPCMRLVCLLARYNYRKVTNVIVLDKRLKENHLFGKQRVANGS